MSAPACLDLTVSREKWSVALAQAAKRGSFRGAIRHTPYPPLMERLWALLVIAASGQG